MTMLYSTMHALYPLHLSYHPFRNWDYGITLVLKSVLWDYMTPPYGGPTSTLLRKPFE